MTFQNNHGENVRVIPRKLKYKLYFARILSSWGDRMWQFAIGLYFIKLYPGSFLLAAIHGIISSLLVFLMAPIIGVWIERTSRLKEIKISLFLQNGCVALGALCVAIYEIESIDKNIFKWVSWTGLILFSICAQIWSFGLTTCLEKDWIICIASDETQLTVLRRLDLICNVMAPSVVGAIMNRSLLWSAIFLMVWNLFSSIFEYIFLKSIFKSVPKLKEEKKCVNKMTKFVTIEGYISYAKTFLMPGISFGLLYLTVLGFDSITIGYASEQGINEMILALVTVGGSIIGVLGTLIYPLLVKWFGVRVCALIGFVAELVFLTLCLVDSVGQLLGEVVDHKTGIALLLTGITAARFGLWVADMGVNQLIQTECTNPPIIASVQTSVNILMELVKFVVVLFVSSVDQFYILCLISYSSVFLGTLIFTIFVIKTQPKCENNSNET